MTEHWQVDGPRVIDVGGDQERVTKVVIAIVGGHVDLVTHEAADDTAAELGGEASVGPYGARVQVSSVQGLPLHVAWDGSTLRVMHGKESEESILDALRRLVTSFGVPTAVVSVAVPASARASVSTVSASVLASGLHRGLTVNTVSGEATVNDISPRLSLHTVSGAAECAGLSGEAKVNTVSGEVTIQSSALTQANVNTVSGDVALDLTDGRATVRSSSVSGDLTVRAPLTGYAVSVSTMSGQAVVDGEALPRPAEGSARTARYRDEGLVVKANSLSGNVVILRADPQDAPPPADRPAPADPTPDAGHPGAQGSAPEGWPDGSPCSGQVDDPRGEQE